MTRRVIVGLTLALGTAALTWALRLPAGDRWFVPAALLTAAIWLAGAWACRPLPLTGVPAPTRQVGLGLAAGLGALVLCLGAGAVVSEIPVLAGPALDLLAHRSAAPMLVIVLITVVNAVAEECFFRGALYDVLPAGSAWLASTALYVLATLPGGIVLLCAAAALVGGLAAGLRRSTSGLLAPVAAHLVWSLGMLLLLPIALT